MNRIHLHKKLWAVMLSLLMTILPCTAAFADTTYNTYSFSDINLAVSMPSDLISFTRSVTSNNSSLDLLGVDDVEELRGLMISNAIYLEAVPEDVSYEVVITGRDSDSSVTNYNEMTSQELDSQLTDYLNAYSEAQNSEDSTSDKTESVTDSYVYTNDTTSYLVVDVTSISSNATTTYVKSYYTVMMGKIIQFTIQSNGEPISSEMEEQLVQIVDSAQYKTIKKSLTENAFFSEVFSSFVTLAVPIAILALIAVVIGRSTRKTNKQIEDESKRAKERYAKRNNKDKDKDQE